MRTVTVALLFVALAQSGLAQLGLGQAGEDPRAQMEKAVRLHQAGQIAEAVALYERINEARPGVVAVQSNLGAAYAALGRYADAEKLYRMALAGGKADARIRLNLALALYKQNRIAEAAPEFAAVYDAMPANEQALTLLAECHLAMGENKRVIELLGSLPLQGQNARQAILGTALLRDGQLERGQKLLDAVLRDGETPEAMYLMATAQIAAEENRAALATLERALAAHPRFAGLHSLYALAKLRDGDPEAAKKAFEEELRVNPADFEANLHLGGLSRLDQDYEAAGRYLERARQMRPRSLGLRYQLANLDLALKRTEAARETLEAIVEEAPDWVEPHITLATVYYRLKRTADGDRVNGIVQRLNREAQARERKQP